MGTLSQGIGYRVKISIALAIRSVDPIQSLGRYPLA